MRGPRPIPFGMAQLPAALAARLAAEGEGAGAAREGAAAPFAAALAPVRRGEVLRLNDPALGLPDPGPTERDWPPNRRVAAHLKRLGGRWNPLSDRFVDAYLGAARAAVARHREEIRVRLAAFDGLFSPEDFVFSAPLPMPRAFLHAPAGGEEQDAAAGHVQVDFAFWLGDRAVAVLKTPPTLLPAAARARDARLAAAGIKTIALGAQDLTGPDPAEGDASLLDRLLGPDAAFWRQEKLPSAPGPRHDFGF